MEDGTCTTSFAGVHENDNVSPALTNLLRVMVVCDAPLLPRRQVQEMLANLSPENARVVKEGGGARGARLRARLLAYLVQRRDLPP